MKENQEYEGIWSHLEDSGAAGVLVHMDHPIIEFGETIEEVRLHLRQALSRRKYLPTTPIIVLENDGLLPERLMAEVRDLCEDPVHGEDAEVVLFYLNGGGARR